MSKDIYSEDNTQKSFSEHIIFVFDENKIIIHSNALFQKHFGFSDEKETIGITPDFLISTISGNAQTFSSLTIQELTGENYAFFYRNENNDDFVYKLLIYKIENIKGKNIYHSLLIDISDLNNYLIERSIRSLVKASQLKDNDTGKHIQRINEYASLLSKHLLENCPDDYPEISTEFVKRINKVASMHDIGKIGIPDFILTKPSKLTEEEFIIMQEHTINGAFILSEIAGQMARDIALFHHEKWNGTGYPYKLKEDQIPLAARITSLSDVYDALRMKRSYKPGFPHEKARSMIIELKETQFDPKLVDAFLEIDLKFNEIYETMKDEDE